jgi:Leucine-rich repeat (LRR) protein
VHVLELQLHEFKLTGSLPPSIANLTLLLVLDLSSNSLTGTLPASTGWFSQLQRLDLNSNQLTGTLPNSLGQLTQVTELDLSTNRLRGTIPVSLGELAQLRTFNLYSNLLTGTIPNNFGELTRLTELSVGHNALSGTVPDSLGQLIRLTLLYLFSNQLTGTMPSSLGNLTRVTDLELSNNRLSGSIPESLGQLVNLTVLYLYVNELTGTIPTSFGRLGKLTQLVLYENHLRGAIPESLGQLSRLTLLYLFNNQLSGTIAQSLGNLTSLTKLALNGNHLSGTIPDSLGLLTHLTELYLWDNQLTSTVPSSLGQLQKLSTLDVGSNRLRGHIPQSLGQLTQLTLLNLWGNQLNGSIPSSLGQLARVTNLHLYDNMLSGSIPSSFGQLSLLRALYLFDNKLTGTLPSTLAACSRLYDLDIDQNLLSGTVPQFVFQFPKIRRVSFQNNGFSGTLPERALNGTASQLQVLFCDNNMLTGTIPDSTSTKLPLLQLGMSNNRFSGTIPNNLVMALRSLDFLFLDNNKLTGPIPQNWSASANTLQYLYLQGNRLSGPVPESLGHMPLLQNMNLSSNRLTGTIPASFQQLISLQVLMLHNNQLRGNVAHAFSQSQTNLSTVQLSGNQLTGTLPGTVFRLPSLSSFAAVGNCFEGPLPEAAICSSASLSALVLDGLHSASECKRSAPVSHHAFKIGTLPLCLLSMSSLATLHLSGSGLTGSVPTEVNVSAVLTDLSLSHNLLTGKIPDSILRRDWDKLDLSYNRLTGTLHSARAAPFGNTTDLYLHQNRLSGVIPGSMQRVNSLSLLENNMFSCRVDRKDVPQQDSGDDKYTCGSDAVDNTLYAWLGAAAAVITAASITLYAKQPMQRCHVWWDAVKAAARSDLRDVMKATEMVCTLGTGSMAYCILVLLPVYGAVNAFHPSFTYKYAWTVSGVFLTGTVAFALEAVLLLLQLPVGAYVADLLAFRDGPLSVRGTAADTHAATGRNSTGARHTLIATAVMILSLVVVTGVNIGFVVATLNLTGKQLTAIQVLLAVFKLGFNNVVVPALENRVKALGGRHSVSTSQLLLVLLNMIVIPCLVVIVISPACFYDALKGVNSVTSSYGYSGDCLSFKVVTDALTGSQTLACAGAQTAVDSTTYMPPFAYSYQCSSSFVTSYAPTFVIMCIISGFVLPACHLLLTWLRGTLSPTSRPYTIVTAATPRILGELPSPQDLSQARSDPLYRPVFDANKLMTSLLTYLALLLTFGALFPPLAVCCAVAMASVALTARLEVGHYVSAAVAADRQDCLDEVESACTGVATPQQLRMALCLVLTVSCMFYTLFLFDTLGYEVGFAGAFWVLIVVPLLPVVTWALHAAVGKRHGGSVIATNSDPTKHDSDLEQGVVLADLRTVGAEGAGGDAEAGNAAAAGPGSSSANPMHMVR